MRRLLGGLLVVALLIPGVARAVETEDFHVDDAQDLIDVCTTPKTDPLYEAAMGFCHGYCVGAYAYYKAAGRKFLCFSGKEPSRTQVIDGFVDWAGAHPNYMQEGPVQTFFKYLAATYPCEKE